MIRYIALLLFSVIAYSCNSSSTTEEKNTEDNTTVVHYQCPMDCENGKTYDKPGKCAVCEMELIKGESKI